DWIPVQGGPAPHPQAVARQVRRQGEHLPMHQLWAVPQLLHSEGRVPAEPGGAVRRMSEKDAAAWAERRFIREMAAEMHMEFVREVCGHEPLEIESKDEFRARIEGVDEEEAPVVIEECLARPYECPPLQTADCIFNVATRGSQPCA